MLTVRKDRTLSMTENLLLGRMGPYMFNIINTQQLGRSLHFYFFNSHLNHKLIPGDLTPYSALGASSCILLKINVYCFLNTVTTSYDYTCNIRWKAYPGIKWQKKYIPDPIRAQIRTMELYLISGALLSSASRRWRICTSLALSRSFSAGPTAGNKGRHSHCGWR